MVTRPSHVRARFAATAVAVVALLGAACGTSGDGAPGGTSSDGTSAVRVVATTDVVREVVDAVLGEQGAAELLVEPGVDPHQFEPSARQVAALREADVVVAIGLGLEGRLVDVLEAAEEAGVRVVRLAAALDPIPFTGGGEHADEHDDQDEDEHGDEHGEGSLDPHVWLDPVRWAGAPLEVARALEAAGIPAPDGGWERRAADVAAGIADQEAAVRAVLEVVPDRCRLLVTNHDAFGYFAERFDFEVIGTVLPGQSSEAEPSARDFAALVDLVRQTGVPAVFSEQSSSSRLAEALAAEAGDVEVVALVGDAVAGGLAQNAARIAAALSDC